MTSLSQVKDDLITFENFKKFCEWFSPSLTTLIKISSEWQCQSPVLLHGFVGRFDAEKMLKGKDFGTFLIRLSESKPGSLAISFNDLYKSNTKVKIRQDHCAMSVNEKGFTLDFKKGGHRLYDTLTDLIYECKKLIKLPNGETKEEAFGKVRICIHATTMLGWPTNTNARTLHELLQVVVNYATASRGGGSKDSSWNRRKKEQRP